MISYTFNSWIIKENSKSLNKNLIYALDINKEGKKKWNVQILGDIFLSPCICNEKMIVVRSLDSTVYAIDFKEISYGHLIHVILFGPRPLQIIRKYLLVKMIVIFIVLV